MPTACCEPRRILQCIPAKGFRIAFAHVRVLLGVVLLVAALLKGHLLMGRAEMWTWSWDAAEVFFEIGASVWLFSMKWPSGTWWGTLGCFGCFGAVATTKLLAGDSNCGCFGSVPTPPWVALGIDVLAIALLLSTYRDSKSRQSGVPRGSLRWGLAIGFALIVVLAMQALLAVSTADSSLTVPDPAQWVGQQLPLLGNIDVGPELASGNWTVILHRHGCSKCGDLLSESEWRVREASQAIAVVELPPRRSESSNASWPRGILVGHLYGRHFVTLPAPLVVQISEGRVVSTGDRFPPREDGASTAASGRTARCRSLGVLEEEND